MTMTTQHMTEERLVAHHYGDESARERAQSEKHLGECAACDERFAGLSAFLAAVEAPEAPERGESYGAEVWGRLRGHLAEESKARPREWFGFLPQRWALGGAFAALIVAAFLVGRFLQPGPPPIPPVQQQATERVRERILMVALSDHLEKSQMVLVELANAPTTGGPVDISGEQQRASDLVDASRLYRQTAQQVGDVGTARVLDELERTLLGIALSPAQLDHADLKRIQQRIEAQGLIFKVRVIGSKAQRERGPQKRPGMRDESNQQSRPRKQT